jgi:hypothetical protein
MIENLLKIEKEMKTDSLQNFNDNDIMQMLLKYDYQKTNDELLGKIHYIDYDLGNFKILY